MPYIVEMGLGAASELPQIRPTSLAGSSVITSMLADLLSWGDEQTSGSLRQHVGGPVQEPVSTGDHLPSWWGHTGSGLGYQLACMNDPVGGTTIAVMVNATHDDGRCDLNFAREVFEAPKRWLRWCSHLGGRVSRAHVRKGNGPHGDGAAQAR